MFLDDWKLLNFNIGLFFACDGTIKISKFPYRVILCWKEIRKVTRYFFRVISCSEGKKKRHSISIYGYFLLGEDHMSLDFQIWLLYLDGARKITKFQYKVICYSKGIRKVPIFQCRFISFPEGKIRVTKFSF